MLAFGNLEPVKPELVDLELPAVGLSSEISLPRPAIHRCQQTTTAVTRQPRSRTPPTCSTRQRSTPSPQRRIRILESVATDPAVPVGAIEVLEPAERADLLSRSGDVAPAVMTLPELLAAAVGGIPMPRRLCSMGSG